MTFPYKVILFDWAYTLVDLVEEDDRAAFLKMVEFLKIMNITEKQFMEIALQHQISPWEYDDSLVTESKKLHDQDQWDDTPIR